MGAEDTGISKGVTELVRRTAGDPDDRQDRVAQRLGGSGSTAVRNRTSANRLILPPTSRHDVPAARLIRPVPLRAGSSGNPESKIEARDQKTRPQAKDDRPSDSRRGDPLAKPPGTADLTLRKAFRPRPALLPLRRLDRPGFGISGKPHRMDSDSRDRIAERLAQQPPRPTLSPEEDSAGGNSCGAKRWLYYRPA